MSRLVSTVKLDLRLQQRYGFYYAAAFVTLVWIVILLQLPAWSLNIAVPLVIFTDLAAVGFYFIAGVVLFEKGERTLFALVVTPLRFWEYLTAKLATLTLLAVVISLIVVVAVYGLDFNWPTLVMGVILMSLISLLVGLIAVAPFSSISEYLIPSQLYLTPLGLPLVHHIGWLESPIFYLIPTHGSLLMLRGAFVPIETWQIIYAVLYQAVWVYILGWIAQRRFERCVVEREGDR